LVTETIAARHAERIQLADAAVAYTGAAVVARARDAAGVVLVVANVALRAAAGRIATDPERLALVLLARDVAVPGQAAAGRAAAVTVITA
jgi:hypothetical protein